VLSIFSFPCKFKLMCIKLDFTVIDEDLYNNNNCCNGDCKLAVFSPSLYILQ